MKYEIVARVKFNARFYFPYRKIESYIEIADLIWKKTTTQKQNKTPDKKCWNKNQQIFSSKRPKSLKELFCAFSNLS